MVFPLINDADIPDLPDQYHWILIVGGLIWAWAFKDKEESARQEIRFDKATQNMWKRIGNISRNRRYPRRSQDDILRNRLPLGPRVPTNSGFPLTLGR